MKNARIAILVLVMVTIISIGGQAQMAPGFALQDNKGTMVFKSAYKGNLIVSFFASYCKPCKKEMPQIVALEQKYAQAHNLTVVFIAVDGSDKEGDAKDKVAKFMKEIGIDRQYLLDMYQVVIEKYNPKKDVPATFLVNRAGYIVFKEIGFREDTVNRLEKAIQTLR